MKKEENLLKIYDAIQMDDHMSVREALLELNATNENSLRELCGLAIIAAENSAINITNEFISFGKKINNAKFDKYLDIASEICTKNINDVHKKPVFH